MVLQYIKELFWHFIGSCAIITGVLDFALGSLWFISPKIKLKAEGKMESIKRKFEAISLPYRLLIILGILYIGTFYASYSLYIEQQQKIPNTDTKQEIRNFFEAVNPEILQRIDAGQKEIHIFIGPPKKMKLVDLSTYPNFNSFLSFQETIDHGSQRGDAPLGFIKQLDPNDYFLDGYYIYPKDALIKKGN